MSKYRQELSRCVETRNECSFFLNNPTINNQRSIRRVGDHSPCYWLIVLLVLNPNMMLCETAFQGDTKTLPLKTEYVGIQYKHLSDG